ncbi:MAG: serine/threonine-protein kinase [Sandaracinaceae bacterium]
MATASLSPDDDSVPMIAPMEPSDDPLGRLGSYDLLKLLAQGGMGRVYLARERGEGGFTRLVALKKIHDHLSRERAFVDMFLDEARIASRIQHPHVCSVYDFGRAGNAYFIAMEYLKGLPLSEVLRELGTRPPEDSPERFRMGAHLLAQACEGLHAAHELRDSQGRLLQVVHRDVSPHNLFVTFDGTARVLDFGIARAVDRVAESTTGRVKGKFAYMAPEQALGKEVDRRADVFSLGVILWELLTLERLFRRDSPAETVLLVVSEPVPAPSMVAPQIPYQLERIAMRALSRDPDKRFASCREMAAALTRATGQLGPPVTAGDAEDWMRKLFPGEAERAHSIYTTFSHDMLDPVEVTGQRVKSTTSGQLSSRRRGRSTGVPIAVALGITAVAAAAAFGIAKLTNEPARVLATLPADAPAPDPAPAPRLEPPEPAQEEPEIAEMTFEAPVELEADPSDHVVALEDVRVRDEGSVIDAPLEEPANEVADVEAVREPPRRGRRGRRREAPVVDPTPTATGVVRFSAPTGPLWGARILHRGRPVGRVPGTVRLPAGPQTVTIVGGGRRITEHVDVRANQDVRVVVR